MKRVRSDGFGDFRCIASACRHSCCIGWEVDVDAAALARYQAVTGPFGARLQAQIAQGDCPHFILGEGERCPFLNGDNLCDIYITLGEDALCQICSDHPRWRSWFADRVEEGLGLCCEEAARQLLDRETPFALVEDALEGAEETPEELGVLLRSREELMKLLQNRGKPLRDRICEVFSLCGIEAELSPFETDLDFLLGLEILDPAWKELLERRPEPRWETAWDRDGEHILCYLLYRYYVSWGLERWAEDFALRFGAFSLRLLGALYATKEELSLTDRVEFVRAWSSELEYSEENLEAIAEYLL